MSLGVIAEIPFLGPLVSSPAVLFFCSIPLGYSSRNTIDNSAIRGNLELQIREQKQKRNPKMRDFTITIETSDSDDSRTTYSYSEAISGPVDDHLHLLNDLHGVNLVAFTRVS
jgi:hypothetical protein